jgi:hypothetical protein
VIHPDGIAVDVPDGNDQNACSFLTSDGGQQHLISLARGERVVLGVRFLSTPYHNDDFVALPESLSDDCEVSFVERLKPSNDKTAHLSTSQ